MNTGVLSLRQKVGQLMMVGFKGNEPSADILRLIEEGHVGGIILFGHNIGTPEQLLRLTGELQTCANNAGHALPLFISIDQENGTVRRLGPGTTVFPGNMLLGAVGSEQATRDVARATAEELKALGINMNLAPVLDVNNNPDNPVIGVRSFGETSEDVTRHGLASIAGHRDSGVMTSAKHFPGHGDTDTDSHLALPTIPHGIERLEEVEFVPFRRAIAAGVDSVMISHVFFPALESEQGVPASLSRSVVTHLLREKMGYDGVVMTDCLEMNAISETVGVAEGALQALKAGVDIVMVSHTYSRQKESIERIVQAVETGELDEAVIDRAVARVQRLKAKYLSWDNILPVPKKVPSIVGGEAHHKLAEHQFALGITLLKNDGFLPLHPEDATEVLVVIPEQKVSTPVEDVRFANYRLADAIREHHEHVQEIHIGISPEKKEADEVLQRTPSADVVIFGTVNAHLNRKQAELVSRILKAGKPVVAVAMRNPYDLTVIQDVAAYLATYEYTFPALSAAADIIFGKKTAQGKLPVTIPGYAERGGGL